MRGLDTNVLLRLLTRDDDAQARRAEEVFAAGERGGETFFVSVIALLELCWTLRGQPYGLARTEIGGVIEKLLGTAVLVIQDRDLVRRALASYREGRGDFSDHLLGWQSLAAGCTDTLTFDRKLGDAPGFVIL